VDAKTPNADESHVNTARSHGVFAKDRGSEEEERSQSPDPVKEITVSVKKTQSTAILDGFEASLRQLQSHDAESSRIPVEKSRERRPLIFAERAAHFAWNATGRGGVL
jgi:hypothetical protein